MPSIKPVDWKTLQRVFELDEFEVARITGSHVVLEKGGVNRPVIILKYKEVGRDIIHNNMRTAGMDRKRYFELLDKA